MDMLNQAVPLDVQSPLKPQLSALLSYIHLHKQVQFNLDNIGKLLLFIEGHVVIQ